VSLIVPNTLCRDRYGDCLDGKSVSLCVRRATYWDPDLGAEDPAKKGVCSNYLCDATPGADVKMTGPSGKVSWLPCLQCHENILNWYTLCSPSQPSQAPLLSDSSFDK